MKNIKTNTLTIIIILLMGFMASTLNAQSVSSPALRKKSTLLFRFPMMAGYQRLLYNKKKISLGAGAEIGLLGAWNILLVNPDHVYDPSCISPEKGVNLMYESLKSYLFFRYYYFKNNFISLSPYFAFSIVSCDDIWWFPNVGLNFSLFYGWQKVKFGIGIQGGLATYYFNQKNPKFFVTLEPFIFTLLF